MWLRLFATVALCSLAAAARAEVFERDWKAPGDGLLTYDNVNGREWLDLSETLLEQFAEPDAEFPEDHYANVVAELGPGGLFALSERRADYLAALEQGFIQYGLEEIWDSLNVNEQAVLASDRQWDAFKGRLAMALDEYHGVDTD